MQESITALVVHQNSEILASLKSALECQGMCIIQAESRAQANRMLGGQNPAPLVFTETQLPDGTWADILADAGRAAQAVNVIVVARVVDTRFYLEAIETGAVDFLAPPSVATDLAYVVPVRVYQQFATLDALSSGRAEITAGRGSSTESFPLFGYSLADYDELYAEKLDLLLKINESNPVTWRGKHRPPLENAWVVPRPERGRLPIWLGTGGNPHSSMRAGYLGLPISYGIIGGQPKRFAPLAELYRRAAREAGVPEAHLKISVASPGFLGDDAKAAKDLWSRHWITLMASLGEIRGFAPPSRVQFDGDANRDGALFVGDPGEIAERIVALHKSLGHMRQFFQMDIGHLPQKAFLHSIELLGTKVKPLVDAELRAADSYQEAVDVR